MRAGDTIVAAATPQGRAARAMIRVSGAATGDVMRLFVGAAGGAGAGVGLLSLSEHAQLPVLLARFPAPHSYTGEHVVEVQVPRNPLLVERVQARLASIPGVRLAAPGEFSARAYLAGKLSLDQAEGVAATVAAVSDEELEASRRLLQGRAGADYRRWAEELTTLLALVEAGIDFTDQEDVVAIPAARLRERLGALGGEIQQAGGAARGREQTPAEPLVVLAGKPNAGKSTLFNSLLGRARAIASPVAGTTRDVLVEPLNLAGVLPGAGIVRLADMAGLDETATSAQAHAAESLRSADVILWCDPTGRFAERERPGGSAVGRTIRLRTFADRPSPSGTYEDLAVCALDGWNLPVLRRAIADAAGGSRLAGLAALLPRHRLALSATSDALATATAAIGKDESGLSDPEVVADAL